MIQSKTKDSGKVGLTPKGAYNATTTYEILDTVLHDHDSWVSLSNANKGNTPADGSLKWFRLTDGGKAAYTESQAAHVYATEAENVNATLVGMTVTITNRQGVSRSVDIGFDIYKTYSSVAAMNADIANIPQSKFVIIATDNPTSAENAQMYVKRSDGTLGLLCDLDQASAAAWADWLNNMKPAIQDATDLANTNARLADESSVRANQGATLANTKAQYAEDQGDRAKGYNDHPWDIGNDGYIYVWDETTQAMVRTNKMIIDFNDLTEEQREQMITEFYQSLVYASVVESEASANELT